MRGRTLSLEALLLSLAAPVLAQAPAASLTSEQRDTEIHALRQELEAISRRLAQLEAQPAASSAVAAPALAPAAPAPSPAAVTASVTPASPPPAATSAPAPQLQPEDLPTLTFFRGTTINFAVDGYYGYNFNDPIGRVNLLRAYDVSSNSFSINQADVVVEHLATPQERFGGRIDLMWGQATETLQGSGVNEQRPQVWRNLFQAYGSYLAPLGSGLQLDFGKFASSLGNEGNYTKDQIAYSRGYLFNYLPFYHTGLRATYNVTPRASVAYWLVNGANDTEDLNAYKSQAFLFTLKPATTLTWNINYYFGQEGRDVAATLNPGLPTGPTQPGLPTLSISPAPDGREHIFDTYATWTPTPRFTLVGEADYTLNRSVRHSQPGRVVIGAIEGKVQVAQQTSLGGRFEYFDDRGGLFSGTMQALKEGTVVLSHTFAPNFLARAEFRRDFSNQHFFLTSTPNRLAYAQDTAEIGLVYWWGTKQGTW